jgi:S-adenosylmethionine hydrolase
MAMITLMTDFGLGEYVAQMKGVIHSINPDARVVDIAHDITPQNIFEGAFTLQNSVIHFKDAIHIAVVDPGVGSSRRPIAIQCEKGTLVGPDNGLLFPAAHRLGFIACYEITNKEFTRDTVSHTFHGRDIFAPVAAHLTLGKKVSDVGRVRKGLEKYMVEGFFVAMDKAEGRIGRVDGFGNLITNIPRTLIEKKLNPGASLTVLLKGKEEPARFVQTYEDGKKDELIALFSSSDHLELCVKNGNASDRFPVKAGDHLEVRF